ncbi:PAQR family membrane homeostasis protein TrhA [Nocardiopsis sp. LOL_012]|uniref:PAQR family membrane homeostasis protein TrhA n=1 Tax=Nocardiopsis sp. LOL_012 TaxID=3345409 RepID=UPI003A86C268
MSEEQARKSGTTGTDGTGTGEASVPERAAAAAGELLEAVKPRLRGWLHLGTAPLALAAGIVLVCLSPTWPAGVASAVYALSSVMLFSTSAVYHVGRWSPRAQKVLRRMDHSNIYLIIAGTYTPFVVLVLDGGLRAAMLALIWTGAIAGVGFKLLWLGAPRWLSTALYLAIGWVAVLFIPQLISGTHPATWILVLVGGVLYSVGAVVYALKWPDPAPRWFGFHEIFHSLTIAAFVCQYIAVSFVVYTSG